MIEEFGLDPWYTCIQFDLAVTWVGRHIENLLMETDKDLKPRYTVKQLVYDDESDSKISIREFIDKSSNVIGAIRVLQRNAS